MYKVTFKAHMRSFWKQLVSSVILSILIAFVLYIVNQGIEEMNIFFTLVVKLLIFMILMLSYIQITKEFDVLSRIKAFLNRSV